MTTMDRVYTDGLRGVIRTLRDYAVRRNDSDERRERMETEVRIAESLIVAMEEYMDEAEAQAN